MCTISFQEFLEKAGQDPALGEKLTALFREHDEKLQKLAAEAGYELAETVPLSDEEAGDASGGFRREYIPPLQSRQKLVKRAYVSHFL